MSDVPLTRREIRERERREATGAVDVRPAFPSAVIAPSPVPERKKIVQADAVAPAPQVVAPRDGLPAPSGTVRSPATSSVPVVKPADAAPAPADVPASEVKPAEVPAPEVQPARRLSRRELREAERGQSADAHSPVDVPEAAALPALTSEVPLVTDAIPVQFAGTSTSGIRLEERASHGQAAAIEVEPILVDDQGVSEAEIERMRAERAEAEIDRLRAATEEAERAEAERHPVAAPGASFTRAPDLTPDPDDYFERLATASAAHDSAPTGVIVMPMNLQRDITGALNSRGDVMLTGSMKVSGELASFGALRGGLEPPEIDHEEIVEAAPGTHRPVSARTAISAQRTTGVHIAPTHDRSIHLSIRVVIAAIGVAVLGAGAVILGIIQGWF